MPYARSQPRKAASTIHVNLQSAECTHIHAALIHLNLYSRRRIIRAAKEASFESRLYPAGYKVLPRPFSSLFFSRSHMILHTSRQDACVGMVR